MYCSMDMLNVDANKTNLNNDEYVHMVNFMPVKYIQYMHLGLTRPIMSFLFGNRTGRQNATQIRESWLWGWPADMKEGRRET